MDDQYLSPQQWNELLALLSLDGVVPLYEVMGLHLEDSIGFVEVLRQVILRARPLYDANPKHIPSISATFINQLDHDMGLGTAQTFVNWSKTVFLGDHSEQPTDSAWDIVFSHWAYSRQKDLKFLPEELQDFLSAGYRANVDTDDLEEEIAQQKAQPLSEWDLEMFARRKYNIHGFSDPYRTVKYIARIHRLQWFVAEFVQKLSPANKALINQHAQALIDELGVWMPGPLPSIDVVGVQ